jgi:hypothetical protein
MTGLVTDSELAAAYEWRTGRRIGVELIRRLARTGELPIASRTRTGRRLFDVDATLATLLKRDEWEAGHV